MTPEPVPTDPERAGRDGLARRTGRGSLVKLLLMPDPENGQHRPYESLYRSTGADAPAYRVSRRQYEPSLTPPEDEPRPEDTFHWLYRAPTEGASGADVPPPPPATDAAPGTSPDTSPRVIAAPGSSGPAPTAVLDVSTLAPAARTAAATRSWPRVLLLTVLLVALLAGTGIALAVALAGVTGR